MGAQPSLITNTTSRKHIKSTPMSQRRTRTYWYCSELYTLLDTPPAPLTKTQLAQHLHTYATTNGLFMENDGLRAVRIHGPLSDVIRYPRNLLFVLHQDDGRDAWPLFVADVHRRCRAA